MGLGVSSDHKFSSEFKLFLFRKINVWLLFLKKLKFKKRLIFHTNSPGGKLGFLDPLILQQNYQLQTINPLWINKWKTISKNKLYIFLWPKIIFLWTYLFWCYQILENMENYLYTKFSIKINKALDSELDFQVNCHRLNMSPPKR